MNPTSPPSHPATGPVKKWRWLLLTFLLPILACSLWAGGPFGSTQPAFQPTGQIVFECWPERRTSHLCVVNADGSGYKQLTFQTTDKWPTWSPDGKRIVFGRQINDQDFTTVLFVMNLDGSNLVQLTDVSIYAAGPIWSPSGDQIAFTYHDKKNNSSGIALVSPQGGGVISLTNSSEGEPHWSPDGKRIAYAIYKPINTNTYTSYIYIMNSDGSNRTRLTSTNSNSPSWSPDGTKIVFTCGGVCVMNSDGSGSTLLDQHGLSPSWSPDGQYIVFYKSDPACILCPTSGQLWIVRADGSQQTKLTDGPVDQNPAWQSEP